MTMRQPPPVGNRDIISTNNSLKRKHIRRCSFSLVIKEMHFKSQMPFKLAKGKKSDLFKSWQGSKVSGNLTQSWREYKLIQLLWTTIWRYYVKLKVTRH